VAVIAQRFARVLELPPTQVETVYIAALVHDVGLRLLDYERLYKRLNLTAEEMRGLAEHPVVGAALAEPLLGSDVAQAVLRHHERVDGKGYPSRLTGQQIPLPARIIQIADAWVAMTARQSYQVTITPDRAASRLREGAGSQFDPALVERFLRALGEISS
jgi:HD-GYP domain-containing protein (c-di-GMP phosphodiesterase class II)